MDSISPNQQSGEPQGVVLSQSRGKKGIIEIVSIFILLIVIASFLNYFNIIPLSNTFPNQLGFLPHRLQQSPSTDSQPTPVVGSENLNPYATLCANFQKTQTKISCEEAIKKTLAQVKGTITGVSIESIRTTIPSSTSPMERKNIMVWSIDIKLAEPIFDKEFNKTVNVWRISIPIDGYGRVFRKPIE